MIKSMQLASRDLLLCHVVASLLRHSKYIFFNNINHTKHKCLLPSNIVDYFTTMKICSFINIVTIRDVTD